MKSCRALRYFFAALLCTFAGTAHSTGPDPDVFPIADLLHPVTVSREQCEQTRDAVWVETSWHEHAESIGAAPRERRSAAGCILYFPSPDAAQPARSESGPGLYALPLRLGGVRADKRSGADTG